MYEHNALGYWSGLALCLTKVRSSRARCPATALILSFFTGKGFHGPINSYHSFRWNTLISCLHDVLPLDICMKNCYCEKKFF